MNKMSSDRGKIFCSTCKKFPTTFVCTSACNIKFQTTFIYFSMHYWLPNYIYILQHVLLSSQLHLYVLQHALLSSQLHLYTSACTIEFPTTFIYFSMYYWVPNYICMYFSMHYWVPNYMYILQHALLSSQLHLYTSACTIEFPTTFMYFSMHYWVPNYIYILQHALLIGIILKITINMTVMHKMY